MKIIEGIKGSKVRINDDKTVDYCLVEKALLQQEYGEYAFFSNVPLEKSDNDDPMYSLVRIGDLIEDAEYDDEARLDNFDKNNVVINEMSGQLFFSSEILKNKDFDYSVEVNTKRDALDMAKDTIKSLNDDDEFKGHFEPTSKLINEVAEAALDFVEWQHLCTCFEEIEMDMFANPECYSDYQENK